MADVQKVMDDTIYALLAADTSLPYGVYNTEPPPFDETPKGEGGHENPIIIFQLLDDPIESTFGSRGFRCEYMVKAVSRSAWPEEASTISSLIDTAMEDASLTPTGFTALWSVRTGSIRFNETTQGIKYTHIGGVFDMWVVA